MILAGDIGGTKTNVALFDTDGKSVGQIIAQSTFPSAKYPSLDAILEEFVATNRAELTHACFGIAGPVVNGQVRTPNLAWTVSSKSLSALLGLNDVWLINDLAATARGIEVLQPDQLEVLNPGEQKPGGNRALIAAGTGLGMATIFWHSGRYHTTASEGGHLDFAPRNELEVDLLFYLSKQFGGHVSYERVLSGPGLFNIYSFLRDRKFAEEPDWLAAQIQSGDKTAAVSSAALSGKSDLAVRALDMFVDIYGAMAGNLALLLMATGGLYIGGGIAPKIRTRLVDGTFMRSFVDKGRLSSLVSTIPVRLILNEKTALHGAALAALNQD
jgi:glucokinase